MLRRCFPPSARSLRTLVSTASCPASLLEGKSGRCFGFARQCTFSRSSFTGLFFRALLQMEDFGYPTIPKAGRKTGGGARRGGDLGHTCRSSTGCFSIGCWRARGKSRSRWRKTMFNSKLP
ncbi:unnamed protein product [Scytosiphon promiscuus]